ncbi:MAG TPA: hypothetical protein PKC30_15650 [Saprospiraceae bacterium]|nr:hypothetical protein [Saprospiraceae bacterium]
MSSFIYGFDKAVNSYTLTVNKANPLLVHVTANLLEVGDTLYINPNCPSYDFPEGWASFIKNLKVSTSSAEIPIQYTRESKWVLGPRHPAKFIQITYTVDLSFAKIKWDTGNEQAGFTDGDAVYLVTKSLFIYPGIDQPTNVTFNLPASWNLAVPWEQTENATMYYVPNQEMLINNSLVFGDFHLSQVKSGLFNFMVALLGDAKNERELFCSTLQTIAQNYLGIFDKTPSTQYLITMFYADSDDGEVFHTSFGVTFKEKLTQHNKIIWANQTAHELFHYWNSKLILAESYSDKQWLSEGTAEYYANMTLLRENIVDEQLFISKIEKILALYQNYRGRRETETSILEAGKSKSWHRFLVYNGGWAIAMALDVIIMENTQGQKTLDDFFRLMLDRYCTNPYTYQDVVNTASKVAGKDLTEFFLKYVEGTDLLPINEYLDKLGYTMIGTIYKAEIYLQKKPVEQPSLYSRWLRR